MRKLTKYSSVVVIVAFLLFLLAANFSSVESRFQCDGAVESNGTSETGIVFMKVHRYRWWVGVWSDSDGAIWLERPGVTSDYFGEVIEIGDQLQFYEGDNSLIRGAFSSLSKHLLVMAPDLTFEGTCKEIGR